MLLSEEIKQYKIIDNYEISNKYLFYFNFRDFNDRVFYINLSKLDTYYAPIPESSKNLDIPKNGPEHKFNGYPFIYWNFCKQKQKQLNLTCPETSNDSLIYRVWITNPVGKIGQPHGLIEIKCDSSNNWKGSLILMHVNFEAGNLSETITDSKIYDLTLKKTNWRTVIDSLVKFKFDVLPTDDHIPDYYNVNSGYNNNGTTFSFEYSSKEKYRFYQYNNIYRAPDKFWQAGNVIKILDLLEQEFNWDSKGREYFK